MLLKMPSADYHSEKGLPLSLSASMARILIHQSPAHAYLAHPKLGGQSRKATRSMDRGSLVHELILGQGKLDGIEVLDYDSYRSKAAQEERDMVVDSGLTPILQKEYAELSAATAVVKSRLTVAGVSFPGQTEGVALWEERADDGTPVPCRARLDHWNAPQIDDLKTTVSAHPDDCVKSIFTYGGDIQCAAYTSAMRKLHPDIANEVKFLFHFVELAEPYLFTTVEPDDSIYAVGNSKWRRAINKWAECIRTNVWGGYFDGVYSASARHFDLRNELAHTGDTESITRFLDPEIRA